MSNANYEVKTYDNDQYKLVHVKQINDDGVVHRYVLHPGDDLINEPESVKDFCQSVWTVEVIDAWQEKLANEIVNHSPDPLTMPITKVQFHTGLFFFGVTIEQIDELLAIKYPNPSDQMKLSAARSKIRHANKIYRNDEFWDLIIAADPNTTAESLDAVWPALLASNGDGIIQ